MNSTTHVFYQTRSYTALTLDPVHVGTGSYRLAGVDNSIVRDPATRLPKIPGTSLSGVARSNAAFQRNTINCAGKGGNGGELHHGLNDNCPVCTAFGFAKGDKEGDSLQGMAQFFDARIVLFPVYSMFGPIWITSTRILEEFGAGDIFLDDYTQVLISLGFAGRVDDALPSRINLGWLMLSVSGTISDHLTILGELLGNTAAELPLGKRIQAIANRLVVVHENLFSRLVNDNLEVRTSVSINPATGAAASGALFTYEAIPRATFLRLDVTYNDPQSFGNNTLSLTLENIRGTVENAMKDFATLGVGGMNTRGMGRIKLFNREGGEL